VREGGILVKMHYFRLCEGFFSGNFARAVLQGRFVVKKGRLIARDDPATTNSCHKIRQYAIFF
jgi:hypothetical protein